MGCVVNAHMKKNKVGEAIKNDGVKPKSRVTILHRIIKLILCVEVTFT